MRSVAQHNNGIILRKKTPRQEMPWVFLIRIFQTELNYSRVPGAGYLAEGSRGKIVDWNAKIYPIERIIKF
jgi:hypothetical protein